MAKEKQLQVVEVPDFVTVRELADLMGASPIDVMKQLINNGIMASINQQIDYDTAAIVVEEMGYEARPFRSEEEAAEAVTLPEWRSLYDDDTAESLQTRPPVVTMLGHVDHGKTSLLDAIRSAHVQEGEAGGITQHIGAYQIEHEGRKITFLDTPGHEAFTAMRARGAQGADLAVLVVAADDGVMPTTREALSHARAAHVPIIVALNKIDRPNANLERVKQQLAELGLVPDEWDGDTLVVPVSAKEHVGLDDLLEAILLVTDSIKIVANPDAEAAGTVLEGRIEPRRGVVATLLVQNGTLHMGDTVVAGTSQGRIKAMFDQTGNPVTAAGPSEPVSVLGLSTAPDPGELFEVAESDRIAKATVEQRRLDQEEATRQGPRRMTLDDIFAQFQAGEAKELNLIIKADVQGSLEPIVNSLEDLGDSDLGVHILHAEVGNISENDIMLASVSGAIVLGFNVRADAAARRVAENDGVDIRLYTIIYKLIEDVELALKGMLEPEYADVVVGVAEVRQVFRISRVGRIAGCYIRSGEARRNAKARVRRGGEIIFPGGSVSSLKRFEEDVREVRTGFECGVDINGFDGFEEGDLIEFFVTERVN
ncbi:MAG: translation initiation factor IF-2 [Anaerolineae bacterium]|nr:translation initiation factor IF-2 [Anaerolineae bacterium]